MTGGAALAWSSSGHSLVSQAVQRQLAGFVPAEVLDRSQIFVEASLQPDLERPRRMSALRDSEVPRHFIDLDRLDGEPLPVRLADYERLLARLEGRLRSPVRGGLTTHSVGILPYALHEEVQRLAVRFAQARRRQGDSRFVEIAWYQAGIVAHYAQDLCQPLHTTLHYDGRQTPEGESPHSGMHRLVDGLIGLLPPQTVSVTPMTDTTRQQDPFRRILQELDESFALVDSVYALEGALRSWSGAGELPGPIAAFARARYAAAVGFTTELIAMAWSLSDEVDLPDWWSAYPR